MDDHSYIAQFQVHQKFVQEHLKGTLNDSEPLLPAFFPPSSYWTSHEKDLFFHGLTVYSRFRPDLIAENIKTKTTFDVCLYLAILQTASSAIPSQIDGSFRGSLEPAMEVSSTWIQNEEKIAAALIQLDSCTWIPGSADGNPENPENHCVCSPQSLLVIGCHAGTPPLNHSSHTELKKSYLSHLDYNCLMALEKIVRDIQLDEVDSASSPASFEQPEKEEGLSNLISPKTSVIAPKNPDPSQLEAQYRLMKRLYMRRKRAQSAGKPVNMEAIRLRPGRKNRSGKPSRPKPETYKAKRKIASFNSSRKETEVNPETGHVLPVPAPADEIDQEEEAQHEPQSKGDRTKDRFLEIGVDAHLASNNNLDFFHLSSLGRLMGLYGSLNDLTKPLSISADTIQLLVIVLEEFVSEVVRNCVISKEQELRLKGTSKVWKYKREKITTGNIKKTLESMKITHSNVKDYFAELVRGKDGVSSPDPSIGTETGTDDDNNVDRKDNDDNQDNDEHKMINEDTFANPSNASDASQPLAEPSQALAEFFWLPESLKRCLLPKHTCDDTYLLPEIDEIGLQRELAEEEELDARDLMVSKEFETGLWGSCS